MEVPRAPQHRLLQILHAADARRHTRVVDELGDGAQAGLRCITLD